MSERYSFKSNLKWVLTSSAVAAVLFVAAYEAIGNIQYYRWKENFDNFGWFGRITIPSPDPVLMWEYRPYGKHAGVKTNRYGFRDKDYASPAKAHDTLRIAFAGDSITLGMGIRLRDTFVRRFEIEANQRQSQIRMQALNFAVDGYNTPQVLEMIRTKVLAFSPDKVVYVMCLNDFDFNESSGEKIRYFRKPKSFFLSTFEKALRRLKRTDFHQYHFDKNRTVVFRSVLEMGKLLEENGIGFQVVLVPIFPESPLSFDDYHLSEVHQRIGDFLKESDIAFLDLQGAFAEGGALPSDYALDIWHPNEDGHRLIAEQLLTSVLGEPLPVVSGRR